jgi:Protein of unknown function (DUF2927)
VFRRNLRGDGKATMTFLGSPASIIRPALARGFFIFCICPRSVLIATVIAAVGICSWPARPENSDIAIRRASERTSFDDHEIIDGFYKIAFGAELQLGRKVERIRKFDESVRIFVANRSKQDRRAEIAAVVTDIRARVRYLDVAITEDRRIANVVVNLVPSSDVQRAIRSAFGSVTAKQIQQALDPQCLSGIGKDERYRIRRAEVILPSDVGEFAFFDCAYEELLQALGAINDDRSVPWTMFNDDVQMGFFDVYDQYLLNILYDPRVRPGMTKKEVDEVIPSVLPAVREWVASINSRLERDPSPGPADTSIDRRLARKQ